MLEHYDLGVESSGNPYEPPITWPRQIFRTGLAIAVVVGIVLLAMPDDMRRAINGHTDGMNKQEVKTLVEICESMNGGRLQIPVRVPGIRRTCTIYYADGTTRITEGM